MPCAFYLNCGIMFIGLSRREPDLDFSHAHASMRAGYFTDLALSQYEVSYDRMALTAENVLDTIEDVSRFFIRRCDHLRASYLNGKCFHCFLDDSELNERIIRHLGTAARNNNPMDRSGGSAAF